MIEGRSGRARGLFRSRRLQHCNDNLCNRSPSNLTLTAIALVLTAAFCHASWNMIVRNTTRPALTTPLMALASACIASPLAVYILITDMPSATGWAFIAATIVLHIAYFSALGYAYASGELSVVYPIARGLGLAIIPVLGVTVLGESMTPLAVAGALSILSGIIAVMLSDAGPLNLRAAVTSVYKPRNANVAAIRKSILARPAIPLALATGVTIGIYSVVDKQGVQHVQPALYMFWLQLGGAAGMMLLMSRHESRENFVDEARRHWKAHIIGGLLQFAAYTLVLTALQTSPVSYVGPFRELAVLFGIVLGALVLKERVTPVRATGAILIAAGAISIAFAS